MARFRREVLSLSELRSRLSNRTLALVEAGQLRVILRDRWQDVAEIVQLSREARTHYLAWLKKVHPVQHKRYLKRNQPKRPATSKAASRQAIRKARKRSLDAEAAS